MTSTQDEPTRGEPAPTGSGTPKHQSEPATPEPGTAETGRPPERPGDTWSWPGWPMLGNRLLELVPEGLREAAAPHPGEGFAVEELLEDGFLVVRAECPGVDPDKDVDVTVEEGVLCIRVQRQDTRTRTQDGHRRSEFRYGSFTRRLPLPRGATADVVSASYQDGILEVRLPAPAPDQQVRRVPVTRG